MHARPSSPACFHAPVTFAWGVAVFFVVHSEPRRVALPCRATAFQVLTVLKCACACQEKSIHRMRCAGGRDAC